MFMGVKGLISTLWELIKDFMMRAINEANALYLAIVETPGNTSVITPFRVSDYLDRMEKVYLGILKEQESQEVILPTLWWGLDGVRSMDGQPKWIRREGTIHVQMEFSNLCWGELL